MLKDIFQEKNGKLSHTRIMITLVVINVLAVIWYVLIFKPSLVAEIIVIITPLLTYAGAVKIGNKFGEKE
jgi:uncharacterized membrane protein YdfJ with MMPL/SSD domain